MNNVYDLHGSRLTNYADAELNVTAEIREHVASQGVILGIGAIVNHRVDTASHEWQLFATWRGLEEIENSLKLFLAICVMFQHLLNAMLGTGVPLSYLNFF
ncbi:hypothetical protein CCR75_003353 [Bremia lactucae]|uniref:Uncharacterized protein n=1 Tax=Bremia lactucae TaxID=4779 RepID=A0A976FHQ9_BRELC|nr:hypothetical protein CCR75_003353 [Bremia lactucae]